VCLIRNLPGLSIWVVIYVTVLCNHIMLQLAYKQPTKHVYNQAYKPNYKFPFLYKSCKLCQTYKPTTTCLQKHHKLTTKTQFCRSFVSHRAGCSVWPCLRRLRHPEHHRRPWCVVTRLQVQHSSSSSAEQGALACPSARVSPAPVHGQLLTLRPGQIECSQRHFVPSLACRSSACYERTMLATRRPESPDVD